MLNIIIRGKHSWKGKSLAEMQKNLVSEGFPPEVDHETIDKIKYLERKHGPEVFKKKK